MCANCKYVSVLDYSQGFAGDRMWSGDPYGLEPVFSP